MSFLLFRQSFTLQIVHPLFSPHAVPILNTTYVLDFIFSKPSFQRFRHLSSLSLQAYLLEWKPVPKTSFFNQNHRTRKSAAKRNVFLSHAGNRRFYRRERALWRHHDWLSETIIWSFHSCLTTFEENEYVSRRNYLYRWLRKKRLFAELSMPYKSR